ncbi:transglutaminase family protein [Candidatus Uabimicrobium sp. HlEnr_7]|uniref:transglutaminase-like domain-containing protein n=1 Tax=Candidatus Uabimicrobium helgolandensis TaxID=3095367 RepID=UPI0035576085
MKMKILVVVFVWIYTSICAENWYGYYYKNQQIGYAKSSYKYDATNNVYHRKRIKKMLLPNWQQTEEISAVLNKNYTVRSLYLSTKQQNEKKLDQHFIIINVGEQITIQTATKVYTYPKKRFYLHLEDFIKFLVKRSPKVGTYYQTALLSSDHLRLIKATARYKGITTIYNGTKVHEFEVTSDELQKNWSIARLSLRGALLSYRIANLSVMRTTENSALGLFRKGKRILAPYIQDVNKIDFMKILYKYTDETGKDQTQQQSVSKISLPQKLKFSQIKKQFSYTENTELYPLNHNYIKQYAVTARYGADEPVSIVRNIARWTHYHLNSSTSEYGNILRQIWKMRKDAAAFSVATLCRRNNIPARVVSGWVYHSGFFEFKSWCEVYLQNWFPIYNGKINTGARFFPGNKKNNTSLHIINLTKNTKKITLSDAKSYLYYNQNTIEDHLLGIKAVRPNDWVLLPKNTFTNILVLRSLKGKGPAILIKVLHSSKKLEDILQSLPSKLVNDRLQILWTKKRKFQNIHGLEGALQSKEFIYRAFIGQRQDKFILVLLFVPKTEFSNIEKEFFAFISSLKFTE